MADQARIQDAKEKFQMAFDHAVREEQAAKAQYEQEESAGILAGLPFDAWVHQNVSSLNKAFSQQVSKSKAVPCLHRCQASVSSRQRVL